MCAGLLRDPENGKPIKKGLTIMSTSERLSRELQGLRCPGNHDHQIIEGSITVDGQRMNRSAFTERYLVGLRGKSLESCAVGSSSCLNQYCSLSMKKTLIASL